MIAEFDEAYDSFQSHKNQISNEHKTAISKIKDDFTNKIDVSEIPETFLHYDFHADHIFVNDHTINGVIDFEWTKFGDPLWDFQKMPIGFSIGDSFLTKDFLTGYGISTFSEKELYRLRFYAIRQGIWQVDKAKHGKYGYPESSIEKGYQLINNTILLASL